MCTSLVVQQEHRHIQRTCVLVLDFSCHLSKHCKPASCRTLQVSLHSDMAQIVGKCFFLPSALFFFFFFTLGGQGQLLIACRKDLLLIFPVLPCFHRVLLFIDSCLKYWQRYQLRFSQFLQRLIFKMHHSIKMIQSPPENQRAQRENIGCWGIIGE